MRGTCTQYILPGPWPTLLGRGVFGWIRRLSYQSFGNSAKVNLVELNPKPQITHTLFFQLHHHVAGRHGGIGGQVLRQRNHRSTPASGQWWRVPLVGFPWVSLVLVTTTAPRHQVAW